MQRLNLYYSYICKYNSRETIYNVHSLVSTSYALLLSRYSSVAFQLIVRTTIPLKVDSPDVCFVLHDMSVHG